MPPDDSPAIDSLVPQQVLDTLTRGPGPTVRLLASALPGVTAGLLAPHIWPGLIVAPIALIGAFILWRRGGAIDRGRAGATLLVAGAGATLLVAGAGLMWCWTAFDVQRTANVPLAAHVSDQRRLVQVTGIIDNEPTTSRPPQGALAAFTRTQVNTHFTLRVETIARDGDALPAAGRLLVAVQQVTDRLQQGDRVRATGWVTAIEPPTNPGSTGYQKYLRHEHIVGRLHTETRGTIDVIDPASRASTLGARVRRSMSDAASRSLAIGLRDQPQRLAFLEQVLLGRRPDGLGDLRDAYRDVGLSHLLAISGAHLGMLLMLVWFSAKVIWRDPEYAAAAVFIVLLVFLTTVPARVPILRAGIMAVLLCAARFSGRRMHAIDAIAIAAVIMLIIRPTDITTAGFQLSFGIVAGLVLFTRPVSEAMVPPPAVRRLHLDLTTRVRRVAADYLAANLVAYAIALPLVAYHFQMVTPLAVLLTLLSLPLVVMVLGLGYLKIIVGLIVPSGGVVMAYPLAWLTDSLNLLVVQATGWPGATLRLAHPPHAAWAMATLLVVTAALSAWFARQRIELALLVMVLVGWASLETRGNPLIHDAPEPVAMRVNMIDVGNGSCFLVQVPDERGRPYVMMFDCGSQHYADVGLWTVVPALRAMGVNHIDLLLISHADFDHYGGVLEVIDGLDVRDVAMTPALMREARAQPARATGMLLSGIQDRGLAPRTLERGWSQQIGDAQMDLLWPTASFAGEDNDGSMVLSIRSSGRRLLLCGDVQTSAIDALLAGGATLKADIVELPHHGSVTRKNGESVARFLEATQPSVMLQSTGRRRLNRDAWPELIRMHVDRDDAPPRRLITARDGMVEVVVLADGEVVMRTFREER